MNYKLWSYFHLSVRIYCVLILQIFYCENVENFHENLFDVYLLYVLV